MELDVLDRKLLYFLDRDARQSIASLAKRLHIGRNVALYRINRLKEQGIIKGAFAEINNTMIGYYSFRIFFKLSNYTEMQQKEFFSFIEKNEDIMWFSRVLGKWDVDIVFMTKEIREFEKFRRNLFLNFNSIIEESEISLLTQIYHYPKDYLLGDVRKNFSPTILNINARSEYTIDGKDEELMRLLTKDAFIGIVDLAQKLKLSINTIKKKIKNLEKNNIILGYRLFLDAEKLGYLYYKLHISLKNYSEKDINSLKSWLASKSNVIYTDHYINGQDFEIELHLKSEAEYINFLEEINREYGRIIKDHFFITFYDVRVFKYLPVIK